jgi:hypothetical protein
MDALPMWLAIQLIITFCHPLRLYCMRFKAVGTRMYRLGTAKFLPARNYFLPTGITGLFLTAR